MRNHVEKGQAMMIATIFFLVISVTIIFGLIGPITRQEKLASQSLLSKQSYFLSEAGVEDVVFRLVTGKSVGTSETLALGGSSTITETSDAIGGKTVVASGSVNNLYRKIKVSLSSGAGAVFKYGTQAG